MKSFKCSQKRQAQKIINFTTSKFDGFFLGECLSSLKKKKKTFLVEVKAFFYFFFLFRKRSTVFLHQVRSSAFLSACLAHPRLSLVSQSGCLFSRESEALKSKRPPAPAPLCFHVPYTHADSSSLLLNEFHMAPQAAVSTQPAEERGGRAEAHTNTRAAHAGCAHSHSQAGSKVTPGRP